LDRNNAGINFFNFLNFFAFFFWEFSSLGWVGTEFGTKSFFSLSKPISSRLAKNNAGERFFNFFNFFAISLAIFFLKTSMNGIRD